MSCPKEPTHPHISSGCVGPIKSPESCIVELDVTHCHCQTPTNNDKGSVNDGGGGGGGGGGCGKPSPCTPCKKCCGGCGKKCKSCGKKKECGGKKVVVTFVDINKNIIDVSKVKLPPGSEPFQNPQKIDQGGTPILPWNSADELKENSPFYFEKFKKMPSTSGTGLTHNKWDPAPEGENTKSNLTTVCQLRELQEDQDGNIEDDTNPYENNTNGENYNSSDEIQDFHDKCNFGFNEFIHDCNDNMDSTTDTMTNDNLITSKSMNWSNEHQAQSKLVAGILDILLEIENKDDVCTDIELFENLKKSLLNIKSTFSYVTRMLFNIDLEELRSYIGKCIFELHVKESIGENITEDIKNYKHEVRDHLIDLHLDNVDALVDYRESFDKYIDELVGLFPSESEKMNLIKQKKAIFDSYVDELVKEDPETKYPILA